MRVQIGLLDSRGMRRLVNHFERKVLLSDRNLAATLLRARTAASALQYCCVMHCQTHRRLHVRW